MTPPTTTAASPRPLLGQGRTLVLVAIALSAFNLRTAVTSLTPLLDVLGREFAFGATFAGVLGMLPSIAFAVSGIATPAVAHRLGLERTALLAMVAAALGLLVRSCADGPDLLLVASLLALLGMGIGNVVLPPLVKRYFGDRVGAVSTLYMSVLQVGTILPALLAVPVADALGWRVSMGVWTLAAVAAALPWLGVLARLKRDAADDRVAARHDRAVDAADAAPELATPVARGRIWRSPVAWGMALMFGCTSLVTYAMFTWLPMLLHDAGASPAFGGTMVALFAGLGTVAALVMPSLAVRLRNPFVLVLFGATCMLAAFAGLLFAPMAAPVLWVGLLGLGPSTFPLALTLINLRTRSPSGSAALSGFMQGVGYALSCLGPLLFGVLHERTGGWTQPFAFLLVAVGVLVFGGWLASKPRFLEDTW